MCYIFYTLKLCGSWVILSSKYIWKCVRYLIQTCRCLFRTNVDPNRQANAHLTGSGSIKTLEDASAAKQHKTGLQKAYVFYCNHQDENKVFSQALSDRIGFKFVEITCVENDVNSKQPLLVMLRRMSDRPDEDFALALENVAVEDYPKLRLIYIHNYTQPYLPTFPTSSKLSDKSFGELKGIFDFAFLDNKMYGCNINELSLEKLRRNLNEDANKVN